MANEYFKFRRVDDFQWDMNRKDCFTIDDMNGVDLNYKIILASECSLDINNCIDDDGTLKEWNPIDKTGVQILNTLGESDGLVPLLFSKGINGEGAISVNATSTVFELTDSIDYVKGAFLISYANGSGYVLAYSINNAPLEILESQLILNVSGLIWGTHYSGE